MSPQWELPLFLFVVTAINYVDRSNLSIASPVISKDLSINPAVMGLILSAFSWSYTAFQLPGAAFVDRFGARISYAISLFWWAIVSIGTGFVNSVAAFFGARLLLGAGEAPAYSINAKLLKEFMSSVERGRGTALFIAGMPFGNAIAPPLLALALVHYGWRGAFIVSGLLTLIVAVIWLFLSRRFKETLAVQQREDFRRVVPKPRAGGVLFKKVLKSQNAWGLAIGNFFLVYVFFMFLTWLPNYLVNARHMTILKTGIYAAIPWLCGTVSALVAGVVADRLIRGGWPALRARKLVMVVGLIVTVAVIPAVMASSSTVAIVLLCVSVAGLMCGSSQSWAAVQDAAPVEVVASVGGFMNFLGNIGGLLAPIVTGWLVLATHSFIIPMSVGGIAAVLGAICWGFFVSSPKSNPQ